MSGLTEKELHNPFFPYHRFHYLLVIYTALEQVAADKGMDGEESAEGRKLKCSSLIITLVTVSWLILALGICCGGGAGKQSIYLSSNK